MTVSHIILAFATITELVLLFFVIVFFARLKRSEKLLDTLQRNQESLLAKLHFNAELEQELVSSFQERQAELHELNEQLETRAEALQALIEKAQAAAKDPRSLKRAVVEGRRKGRTPHDLARETGLSLDEVELILMEARR